MWIMTKYGILMPAALPVEHRPRGLRACDLQVRSRDRDTLARVRREMRRRGLVTSAVRATPTMDYEYRVYCRREDFAEWVRGQVREIDFLKFKPAAERVGGRDLYDLYAEIWYVIARHYDSAVVRPSGRVGGGEDDGQRAA